MSEVTPLVPAEDAMIVLDLGKKKKKDIRRLREGAGPLTDDVREAISELRAQGQAPATGPVVVVVVRQKPKKSRGWY